MRRSVLLLVLLLGGCLGGFPPRLPASDSDALSGDTPPADAAPDTGEPDAAPTPDALRPATDAAVAPPDAPPGAPRLSALHIEPGEPHVRFGEVIDLRLVGELSDDTTADLTAEGQFAVADPDVAMLAESPGRVHALGVGLTTVSASYGGLLAPPVVLQVTGDPTTPPVARLRCPPTGQVGAPLMFDGASSTDPDGQVVGWLFDFGDASDPEGDGSAAQVTHAFQFPGEFDVKLTVVDDSGTTGQDTCPVIVDPPSQEPPTVRIVAPEDGESFQRRDRVEVQLEVSAAAGREIRAATLIVNGNQKDEVLQPPWTLSFTVSDNRDNGDVLPIRAQVKDDLGTFATSEVVHVVVQAGPHGEGEDGED